MNNKYGRAVTDSQYIKGVMRDAQGKIDTMQAGCDPDDCYSEDGMKEIILDWLDGLGIYPDDIGAIFAQLDF